MQEVFVTAQKKPIWLIYRLYFETREHFLYTIEAFLNTHKKKNLQILVS